MKSLPPLQELFPLSPNWGPIEVFSEKIFIHGVEFYLCGLATRSRNGRLVTGSAVGVDSFPAQRAYFELLERTSIFEVEESLPRRLSLICPTTGSTTWVDTATVFPISSSPTTWCYAKSNGVAAHLEPAQAFQSAEGELIERDAVLRSWYGHTAPREIPLEECSLPKGLEAEFDFRAFEFSDVNSMAGWFVVGLFGFPKREGVLRAYGFGARQSKCEAIEAATRECYQSLGFLWGESATAEEPKFSPSPDYHQEIFLRPLGVQRIQRWLDGEHLRPQKRTLSTNVSTSVTFADLTPAHLKGKILVVKALAEGYLPLVFGHCDKYAPTDFPAELLIHPIA